MAIITKCFFTEMGTRIGTPSEVAARITAHRNDWGAISLQHLQAHPLAAHLSAGNGVSTDLRFASEPKYSHPFKGRFTNLSAAFASRLPQMS